MTDEAPAPEARTKFTDVTLEEPIKRGETEIATITLRKPKAGELRGLTIEEVISSDVTTLIKLIPRISNPPLIEQEVSDMDAPDIAQCAGAVRGFFMTRGQQEVLNRMIEESSSRS